MGQLQTPETPGRIPMPLETLLSASHNSSCESGLFIEHDSICTTLDHVLHSLCMPFVRGSDL